MTTSQDDRADLDQSSMRDAALDYVNNGFAVIPLHYMLDVTTCSCGSLCGVRSRGKHPLSADWNNRGLKDAVSVEKQWARTPDANIGIVTGQVSNIFAIDTDGDIGAESLQELELRYGGLPLTRTISTGSGGRHYYFLMPEGKTIPNSVSKIAPKIDVRGDGGMVVAPPSVSIFGAYTIEYDDPIAVAPEWLIAVIEHAHTPKPSVERANVQPYDGTPLTDRQELYLEGVLDSVCGELAAVAAGMSGRHDKLYTSALVCGSFHAGAGLDLDYAYERLMAASNENGSLADYGVYDVERTIRDGFERGSLNPRGVPDDDSEDAQDWIDSLPDDDADEIESDGHGVSDSDWLDSLIVEDEIYDADSAEIDAPSEVEHPSWAPLDLTDYITGEYEPVKAGLFYREDGQGLFYPGHVSTIMGEPESGKSMIALAVAAWVMNNDPSANVLMIDNESQPGEVVDRLRKMGASNHALATQFSYVQPHARPYDGAERAAFLNLLRGKYELVILDGITEMLSVFGFSSIDNDEVTSFIRAVPRRLAVKTGACVIMVDHIAKASEGKGRFAIGAQAKLAAVDGCSYLADVKEPMGRGLIGRIELRVGKDRQGDIRPASGPMRQSDRTQHTATIMVDSQTDPSLIQVSVLPPGPGRFEPSNDDHVIWEPYRQIYDTIAGLRSINNGTDTPQYPSQRQVETAVGGQKRTRELIKLMLDDGWLIDRNAGRTGGMALDVNTNADLPWLSVTAQNVSEEEVDLWITSLTE